MYSYFFLFLYQQKNNNSIKSKNIEKKSLFKFFLDFSIKKKKFRKFLSIKKVLKKFF